MDINQIKLFYEYVCNRAQVMSTTTPQQFNLAINRAIMQVFENDYQEFVKTQAATDYLAIFLKSQSLIVSSNGISQFPSDFEHTAQIKYYYVDESGSGTFRKVEEVKIQDWAEVEGSQLFKATTFYPKYCEYATTIQYLPRTLGVVNMDYFRTPTTVVWAYTTVNNEPVYDAANSVQLETTDYSINKVIGALLGYTGINLREGQFLEMMQMYKAENQ